MRRPGQVFTEERVKWLKMALLEGAHPVALARVLGVSANTIRRIRDGETYNWVVVPGEDRMRVPIVLEDRHRPEGESFEVRERAGPRVADPMGKEELRAMEERLLGVQARVDAGRRGGKGDVDALLPEGLKGIFGEG